MIALTKGTKIDLTKSNPSLKKLLVGLAWKARATDGVDFDLDASAILLDANGKALSEKHFVFYSNPVSPDGAVKTHGDNRTGSGDGDDETITIDLEKVDANVHRIQFQVTIHDAAARNQNFGQVSNTRVRFADEDTGAESHSFDPAEDFSTETCVVLAEIYRHDAGWKINAIGQGYASGLIGVLSQAGLAAE
jgi:tellurium resistance protein TerD